MSKKAWLTEYKLLTNQEYDQVMKLRAWFRDCRRRDEAEELTDAFLKERGAIDENCD